MSDLLGEMCPVCKDTHVDWEDLSVCFHKLVMQVAEDQAAIRALVKGWVPRWIARDIARHMPDHAEAIVRATE